MPMTSRERMMIALENGRPDRLPCQVHNWMNAYLKRYLPGLDAWAAYDRFGLDYAMYVPVDYTYDDRDLANWRTEVTEMPPDEHGNRPFRTVITTPEGQLTETVKQTDVTGYTTEYLWKDERDFELWNKYVPVPARVDFTALAAAKERLGDKGIIRTFPWSPGQGSPWQSFCHTFGTQESIYLAMDRPDWMHHAMGEILKKTLRVAEMCEGICADLIETGGGAGSNTVISPSMFREFCLPYDRQQVQAFHSVGLKVVYHLCGGLMKMLDLVVEMGADALETMTPPSMGGDCDLTEASRRVGDRLAFVGGFDQNAGFETGTPAAARRLVHECFEATKDNAGYICSPSDHFFRGAPENIQAFADACKECVY